jgi:peptidoglycan-N-acetylglucosamine deacetylase
MLSYKNTIITFFILFAAVLILDIFIAISLFIYAFMILGLIALLAWGSVSIQKGYYIPAVCSVKTDRRMVALSFDDGPDEHVTPIVLDILKSNGVKAVFFIVGEKAGQFPDMIKRIDEEGHILGNHSYTHHYLFDFFSVSKMKKELAKTDQVVYQITGRKMKLFRPPYGVTNPLVSRTIREMSYHCIGWSLRSNDTTIRDGDIILDRLKAKVKTGDIVLFHDNRKVLPGVLDTFIRCMKEKQFIIERLDKFANIHAYDI